MDVRSKLVICCKFDDDPVNPKEKKQPPTLKNTQYFGIIVICSFKTKNLLYTKNLEFIYSHMLINSINIYNLII